MCSAKLFATWVAPQWQKPRYSTSERITVESRTALNPRKGNISEVYIYIVIHRQLFRMCQPAILHSSINPGRRSIYIYIYIYIYIVRHRHTVSLNHDSSVWLDTRDFVLVGHHTLDYRHSRRKRRNSFRIYFLHTCYRLPECSFHEKSFAFTRMW